MKKIVLIILILILMMGGIIMKAIKKVEVTPLDINYGKIINSFNTTDDKTKNAPSMHIVEEGLNGKSNTGHTHDDRYYTETETDNLLNGKANSSHTHTKSQITDFAHNHDDRYYTESESDAKYQLKGDFAVLTGHIDNPSGQGEQLNYPEGFTNSNCIVIGAMHSHNSGTWQTDSTVLLSVSSDPPYDTYHDIVVELNSSKVVILTPYAVRAGFPVSYKVVLMKIS